MIIRFALMATRRLVSRKAAAKAATSLVACTRSGLAISSRLGPKIVRSSVRLAAEAACSNAATASRGVAKVCPVAVAATPGFDGQRLNMAANAKPHATIFDLMGSRL
jgi:hypothetical protein